MMTVIKWPEIRYLSDFVATQTCLLMVSVFFLDFVDENSCNLMDKNESASALRAALLSSSHIEISRESLLPQQPYRWRQHLLFFWTFYFFLFLSDQIELVEPLTQGLPKHVCKFKLWRENEWRPWAFVELENQFIWRTTSCLWSNQPDFKPATRTKTSLHGCLKLPEQIRRGWLFHVIILFKKKNTKNKWRNERKIKNHVPPEMEFCSFNPQFWLQLQVNCVIQRQDHKICQVPTWMLPCDLGLFL